MFLCVCSVCYCCWGVVVCFVAVVCVGVFLCVFLFCLFLFLLGEGGVEGELKNLQRKSAGKP